MTKSRRVPTQSRSREKYEQIIQTAKDLIGNKGNDSVSMREISKESGVALASIYQYFPDKNAILLAIMEDFFGKIRTMLEAALEGSNSIEELIEKMHKGIDLFNVVLRDDPVIAILWGGMQANPKLVELDAQDSLQNARIIAAKVTEIVGDEQADRIQDITLLMIHMAGSVSRLALALPDYEDSRLIDEYKALVALRLRHFSE